MSSLILTEFVGLTFNRKRNPRFATRIKTTTSGRELRQRFSAYPLWHFTVPIEFIVNDVDYADLDKLLGFYLAVGGQEETWLYDCPRYNVASKVYLGEGSVDRKDFQLRIIHAGGFVEPVHNPKPLPQILIDDVPQTGGYSISPTGLVSFTTGVSSSSIVSWSGGYYHRCRFDGERPDFNESAIGMFDFTDFSFVGSPVNLL